MDIIFHMRVNVHMGRLSPERAANRRERIDVSLSE